MNNDCLQNIFALWAAGRKLKSQTYVRKDILMLKLVAPALLVTFLTGIAAACGNDPGYDPGGHTETRKCDPTAGTSCAIEQTCSDNLNTPAIDCACR